MLDTFLRKLYERVNLDIMEAKDIDGLIREEKLDKHTKVIPIDILQMHINEILMQQQQRSQNNKAIEVLESVKMATEWKFNSITEVVKYIDKQLTELRGRENDT